MIPEENKENGISKEEAADLGMEIQALLPQGDTLNWTIWKNFLVLLHSGRCLTADGIFGPHLRCYDNCLFSLEYFQDYTEHRFHCEGDDSCPYPFCKESMSLYKHFVSCRLPADCERCKAPIDTLLHEFIETLIRDGKEHVVAVIRQRDSYYWKRAFFYLATKKWV